MLVKILSLIVISFTLSGCGEKWSCQTKGDAMFSMSESGGIGSADKGCSCSEMRNFELNKFGKVDEEALKNDFGC